MSILRLPPMKRYLKSSECSWVGNVVYVISVEMNCPGFPERNRLNKRAGNSKEGIHAGEKAHPEATSRTPSTRSSVVQGESSQLLQQQRGIRPDRRRSSDAPASRMVHQAEREVKKFAHCQRDPEEGVSLFCPSGARPPVPQMITFIEEHREACGRFVGMARW